MVILFWHIQMRQVGFDGGHSCICLRNRMGSNGHELINVSFEISIISEEKDHNIQSTESVGNILQANNKTVFLRYTIQFFFWETFSFGSLEKARYRTSYCPRIFPFPVLTATFFRSSATFRSLGATFPWLLLLTSRCRFSLLQMLHP